MKRQERLNPESNSIQDKWGLGPSKWVNFLTGIANEMIMDILNFLREYSVKAKTTARCFTG